MYPKYSVLDMIQRIHLCCGSFRSIICFLYFSKETIELSVFGLKSGFGF